MLSTVRGCKLCKHHTMQCPWALNHNLLTPFLCTSFTKGKFILLLHKSLLIFVEQNSHKWTFSPLLISQNMDFSLWCFWIKLVSKTGSTTPKSDIGDSIVITAAEGKSIQNFQKPPNWMLQDGPHPTCPHCPPLLLAKIFSVRATSQQHCPSKLSLILF